jgi:transcriptional regulator with XRE-family HTH domain/tetratricopeptide (TPR) repeat protein
MYTCYELKCFGVHSHPGEEGEAAMIGETRNSNRLLRYQREQRGWTQARLAEELYQRCEDDSRPGARGEINAKMIGAWERGEHMPSSYYQEKLRLLFGKSAEELGFIESPPQPGHAPVVVPSSVQQVLPALFTPHQAIDLLCEAPDKPVEQQLGAWLALGAAHLAPLFASGWSLEDMLTSLKLVLPGVQAMSKFSRRTLFKLGAAAVVSNIPIPEGKHISAEDRAKLHSALGESIAASWKLFHTAGNAQVLAVSQAQLYLVQQAHSMLSSRERSMFYSSVYNLMGKAMHFQGHNQQALDAHINAHVAAMATGDPWFVTQSLICQADSYQALGQHIQAMEAIEEALHIVGNPTDEVQIRSKAQLLASWADNAITLKTWTLAEEKLAASATLLDQIHSNEQFDQASWLQLQGKYAFEKGDYGQATEHLEAALRKISPHWIVRQVLILLPLVAAYTWQGDRDACLVTATRAFSAIQTLSAPTVNKLYTTSLQGLREAFPNDTQIRTFVADTVPHLLC